MEASCHQGNSNIEPETGPVRITRVNDRFNFHYEGTGKQAGLLLSVPLSKLVRECSVTLTATLGLYKTNRSNIVGASSWKFDSIRVRPLRIVVYGLSSEQNAVTDILDEGRLFLQRPEGSEYDRRVKYLNPMYLLPPGTKMPQMRIPSVTKGRSDIVPSIDDEPLGEIERDQILRIFDETGRGNEARASCPLEVKQSSRIISKLKEYAIQFYS